MMYWQRPSFSGGCFDVYPIGFDLSLGVWSTGGFLQLPAFLHMALLPPREDGSFDAWFSQHGQNARLWSGTARQRGLC